MVLEGVDKNCTIMPGWENNYPNMSYSSTGSFFDWYHPTRPQLNCNFGNDGPSMPISLGQGS